MSAKLSGQVWELDLPVTQQLVLLGLADHGHPDGTHCYPGVRYLAWKTNLSQRTVQRALRELEESGLIEAVRYAKGGFGHATEYSIHIEKGVTKSPFSPIKRVTTTTEKGDTPVTPTVRNQEHVVRANALTSPTKKKARPRDLLWDAVVRSCGEPQTLSERGRYNRAVKEIRDAGGTPTQAEERANRYRAVWPEMELTPTALSANWGRLSEPRKVMREVRGTHGSSVQWVTV